MPMTGIIAIQIWEFHCLSGEPKTTKKKFVGSVEELYEIEKNRLQGFKRNPFKGFERNMADQL
jgi:hypothetical protein